jgi:hypothetical protein
VGAPGGQDDELVGPGLRRYRVAVSENDLERVRARKAEPYCPFAAEVEGVELDRVGGAARDLAARELGDEAGVLRRLAYAQAMDGAERGGRIDERRGCAAGLCRKAEREKQQAHDAFW